MKVLFRSLVPPATLVAVIAMLAGCAAEAASEDTGASDEDLSSARLSGYYELAATADGDTWIEQLALHDDGAFEANMGNDVSNLSGHHYQTTGTFGVTQHGGTSVLTLHAVGEFAGSSSYDVVVQGGNLSVKDHGVAGSHAFAMKKTKLATITFNADWTITQTGPLVANAPYLVRYAASRNDCAAPAGGGLSLAAFGRFENGVVTSITQPFNTQPVNGYLGAFGSVPALGSDLAVWFKGGAVNAQGTLTSCTHWDSNLAKNYHFAVAAK